MIVQKFFNFSNFIEEIYFQANSFDSLNLPQKFCTFENVSKCAILSKETHYFMNSQGVYYTTSIFMNFTNITAENWVLILIFIQKD